MSQRLLPSISEPRDLRDLSIPQLEQLAEEMREVLCNLVACRSAHFASNLGVVELCIALHQIFDFRKDRLIWDTGHQIYPHKLITGRYPQFDTMRTKGGLMGYPNPAESPFDLFMTGHAGASIATALGLASGDSESTVREAATALEITNFRAACSPDDKLEFIDERQRAGEIVVMVGDGINDAPVLAGADASIAPSHGALLAQTNADVVMLGETLDPLVTAIRTARQTMRIVRQNLAWAIVYNATALPLAALGYVPPWAAAIGMSASSLIVVLNALRLSRYA